MQPTTLRCRQSAIQVKTIPIPINPKPPGHSPFILPNDHLPVPQAPPPLISLNMLPHTPSLLLHTRIPQPAIDDASPPPLALDASGLAVDALVLRSCSQQLLSLLPAGSEAEVVEDFVQGRFGRCGCSCHDVLLCVCACVV